jgi:hypothetical protein
MQCECGREIVNVPEHLQGLAKWQCKECGRNIDTAGHKVKRIADENREEMYEIRKKAA